MQVDPDSTMPDGHCAKANARSPKEIANVPDISFHRAIKHLHKVGFSENDVGPLKLLPMNGDKLYFWSTQEC